MKLVNCTGEDVYVLVGNTPVLLPDAPYPVVYSTAHPEDTVSFEDDFGSFSLELDDSHPTATLYLPEPTPGVSYLVEREILLRFPSRSDFLTPVAFTFLEDSSEDALEIPTVLSAVARSLPTLTDPLPNLSRSLVEETLTAALTEE